MSQVERYVDRAMYPAEPVKTAKPRVHLLAMTPDPLGQVAAMSGIYEGKVFRSLSDVTDDDRKHYWAEIQKTHLQTPLEVIKLHFLLEGVDRAFTHQLVRQRIAQYAQESLRFAVKEDLQSEVPYPVSLLDPDRTQTWRNDVQDIWDDAVRSIDLAYRSLIARGVPAEDARGLLPTAVQTRIHYVTDLKTLALHAGNRLCTQAQFHWRTVFLQMREAIRYYPLTLPEEGVSEVAWQFEVIANSDPFTPVCYQQGLCPFKADFDRGCTIRERVDLNAKHGIPSNWWDEDHFDATGKELIPAIRREEWLDDPKAGWVQ